MGVAEIYLVRDEPQQALALLDQRSATGGFFSRLRRRFSRKVTDDELHDDGLRLRALLQQDRIGSDEFGNRLVERLNTWAPRLLEGEARGQLSGGHDAQTTVAQRAHPTRAFVSLPTIQAALRTGVGEKHAARGGVWRGRWPRIGRPAEEPVD